MLTNLIFINGKKDKLFLSFFNYVCWALVDFIIKNIKKVK